MRRIAQLLVVGVVVGAGVALGPAAAWAYGLGLVRDPELAKVAQRASDYLVEQQLPGGGWAWHERARVEGRNFGAVVAESLLASYEQTNAPKYIDAARRYGDGLVRRFEAQPKELPFKPDIDFLVRLTEVTGDEAYARVAQRWFDNVVLTSPTGAEEVGRILRGRAAIADITGYDVALGIRAALAVEAYAYARQMADAVLAQRRAWLHNPKGTYGTISRAALLDALARLDGQRYALAIRDLTDQLVTEQTPNGSWCINETQATAYAARALADQSDPRAKAAAQRAAVWLRGTLLQRGAWAHYNDGLPEPFVGDVLGGVQAEVLSALIVSNRR